MSNAAEDRNNVLQAANLYLRGSPRDHFFNCARAGTFLQALETPPPQPPLNAFGAVPYLTLSGVSQSHAWVQLRSRAELLRAARAPPLAGPGGRPPAVCTPGVRGNAPGALASRPGLGLDDAPGEGYEAARSDSNTSGPRPESDSESLAPRAGAWQCPATVDRPGRPRPGLH